MIASAMGTQLHHRGAKDTEDVFSSKTGPFGRTALMLTNVPGWRIHRGGQIGEIEVC